ncbi:uracil phosphoribosyltransferase, partial [Staphylococcus epidermidis]|uniref:uracil phosphoribosyltransferase n=1 Tax=Staphylococcus epidermidis TaxID=1282 RepID=UPI0037D9AF32
HLQLQHVQIQTPLTKMTAKPFPPKNLPILPILRPPLRITHPLLTLLPPPTVPHIGLYTHPHTLQPLHYFPKIPQHIHQPQIILLHPILPTPPSPIQPISSLKKPPPKTIPFISLIP